MGFGGLGFGAARVTSTGNRGDGLEYLLQDAFCHPFFRGHTVRLSGFKFDCRSQQKEPLGLGLCRVGDLEFGRVCKFPTKRGFPKS